METKQSSLMLDSHVSCQHTANHLQTNYLTIFNVHSFHHDSPPESCNYELLEYPGVVRISDRLCCLLPSLTHHPARKAASLSIGQRPQPQNPPQPSAKKKRDVPAQERPSSCPDQPIRRRLLLVPFAAASRCTRICSPRLNRESQRSVRHLPQHPSLATCRPDTTEPLCRR